MNMELAFDEPEMDGVIYNEPAVSMVDHVPVKLGGCADPSVVNGSILDQAYIPRKASRLGNVPTDPFGCVSSIANTHNSSDFRNENSRLRWELGAVSECGVRDSNEDSYLVVADLLKAFDNGVVEGEQQLDLQSTVWNRFDSQHSPGIFAVFDGHCGDHAARFAAERLTSFIHQESVVSATLFDEQGSEEEKDCFPSRSAQGAVESILRRALRNLDTEFCNLCVQGGRDWESGATALVAALVNEHLIVANLGDSRGVVCRSVRAATDGSELEGWNELPLDDYHQGSNRRCLWKEVTDVHSPSREDEKHRIEKANGWVTTEKEIPIGQLQRMVLFDEDVIDILKRCFADRYNQHHTGGSTPSKAAAPQRILQISRVCGELAVSRSIGDRDFKASFNEGGEGYKDSNAEVVVVDCETMTRKWDCPLLLPYPEDHSRSFVGDLVSNHPDFQALRVGEEGVLDEFLLLACDGLWDVMDSDDAVRVTRDLLFEKQWPAKKAAARLAELAIHLGSSDNITVIVIRFFTQ